MSISNSKLQEFNKENLFSICELLDKFDPFVFYGTLLGIERDKNIIKGDDDIDILVDHNHKKQIIELLNQQDAFTQNTKNANNFFLQLCKIHEGTNTFVDLYFYINDKKNNYLIEKHNFLSFVDNPNFAIHIPREFIFPLKKSSLFPNINIPNKPLKLCEFLYGSTWRFPMKKNSGYRMEIVDNKPKLIKRSKLGSLTRYLKFKLTNQFKKK